MRENDSQATRQAHRSNSRITDDPRAILGYAIFAAAGVVGCFFGLIGFISLTHILAEMANYSGRMPATMQCVAPGRTIAVDEMRYDAVEIRESVAHVRWFFATPLAVIGLGALGWIGSKRPW